MESRNSIMKHDMECYNEKQVERKDRENTHTLISLIKNENKARRDKENTHTLISQSRFSQLVFLFRLRFHSMT